MSASESGTAVKSRVALRNRARGQLVGLLAQLVLGMAVNLIGEPDHNTGAAGIASSISLILHIAIAILLVFNGILCAVNAGRAASVLAGLGWFGLAVIVVTFVAGVLTMITNSGWYSFLMALGAAASLVIYGVLFMRAAQGQSQAAQR